MGFRKFADAEKVEVLSPQEQRKIADNLKKTGKITASNLTSEERRKMFDS